MVRFRWAKKGVKKDASVPSKAPPPTKAKAAASVIAAVGGPKGRPKEPTPPCKATFYKQGKIMWGVSKGCWRCWPDASVVSRELQRKGPNGWNAACELIE